MPKKIVFYLRDKHSLKNNFFDFPGKTGVYLKLFQTLQKKDAVVYLVNTLSNYSGNRLFTQARPFDGVSFSTKTEDIIADIIFDRSSSDNVIPDELLPLLFNSASFKKLCTNKNSTQKLLASFMPNGWEITSLVRLKKILAPLNNANRYVLKPSNGMKGSGILIGSPQEILGQIKSIHAPHALQEFIDTSAGIPGIMTGLHDLRVIIIGGEIIMASIRTPAPGSLLANVAQGGLIKEVPYASLPECLHSAVASVQKKIDSLYDFPFYSIDFGISHNRAYVFELNDRIGFPNDSMPSALFFAEKLANRLLKT